MSRPGDELLAVISARQRLPWRAFRDAFNALHSRALASRSGLDEPLGLLRPRSLRLLSELAHAELPPFQVSTAVAAAPTVLARVPRPGLPRAVLCGSRGLSAAAELREACSTFGRDARVITATHPYSGGYAPSAIAVEASDDEVLQLVAERARIRFAGQPPAWGILRTSASVGEYEASLIWTTERDPTWPRMDFDPSSLTFSFERQEDAIRLSSFKDPVTRRQIHRIWRNGAAAITDRDWGRWLYLRERAVPVVVSDSNAQAMGIPATVPLPRLLARALALFAGLAPLRRGHPANPAASIDLYAGIPSEAAELLALKLGQQLVAFQLGR